LSVNPHVASGHANHLAFFDQQFRSGKTGKYFHAQFFCAGGQKAGDIAQ
jgi:hypothetical protein